MTPKQKILFFSTLFLLSWIFWLAVMEKPVNEPAPFEKIPNMIIEDWDGEKG